MSFIPNSFTPNDDGLNEVFLPVVPESKSYTLQVFNRWGTKIFETSSATQGWDGRFKGKECQADVYAYTLEFTEKTKNKKFIYNGKVLLIR